MTNIEAREGGEWIVLAPGISTGADAGDIVDIEIQLKNGQPVPETIRAKVVGHRAPRSGYRDGRGEPVDVPVSMAVEALFKATRAAFPLALLGADAR